MTKDYIGVKKVTAWPEERDGKPGYSVKYEDGYSSWCPKDTFEKFNFPLENGENNVITQGDIDNFITSFDDVQLGDTKPATLVIGNTLTGFQLYEISPCVDPKNYNHELGVSIATEKAKNQLWPFLGFLLRWATNGLKKD